MAPHGINTEEMNNDEKLDLIISLLQGNKLDPKDFGLIGEVRRNTQDIKTINAWRNWIIAWAVGFSVGAGALISYAITKVQNAVISNQQNKVK